MNLRVLPLPHHATKNLLLSFAPVGVKVYRSTERYNVGKPAAPIWDIAKRKIQPDSKFALVFFPRYIFSNLVEAKLLTVGHERNNVILNF